MEDPNVSHKFKVGDRVVYVGKSLIWSQHHKMGWLGTVEQLDVIGVIGSTMVSVIFDIAREAGPHTVYPENIELYNIPDQIAPRAMRFGDLCDWSLSAAPDVIDAERERYKSWLNDFKFAYGDRWDVPDMSGTPVEVNIPYQYRQRPWSPTFSEWATNHRTAELIKRCVNAEAECRRLRMIEKQRDEYADGYAAQRTKVAELESTIKINEDFIDLLQQRLGARLAQLDRIQRACNVQDGGASLDPANDGQGELK
jgi:hypothetical protein